MRGKRTKPPRRERMLRGGRWVKSVFAIGVLTAFFNGVTFIQSRVMNPWVRCWCSWCWAVFPFNYWAVLPPSTAKDAPVMKGALSVRAEVDDRAHCFVTGNEGILGHAPFVIDHGKVRVAYPAVSNLNFDFFRSDFARIEAERL